MKRICLILCMGLLILAGSAARAGEVNAADEISPGITIEFGTYEQNNDPADGPEPVRWLVLEVEDGTALLLSERGLDCKPFHTENTETTWQDCSLRAWLNQEFYNAAFSEEEQKAVLLSDVDNGPGQSMKFYNQTSGGENTRDWVYLLSAYETNHISGVRNMRTCQVTDYAAANGAYRSELYTTEGEGYWWTRTPGKTMDRASYVSTSASRGFLDKEVTGDTVAVRPVIRIDIGLSGLVSQRQARQREQERKTSPEAFQTVGDIVTFGRYEQDDCWNDGMEPVEWIVLDFQDGKALLLSRYALINKAYQRTGEDVSWETSDIRKWLNSTFLEEAFTPGEQAAIVLTCVDNSAAQGNPNWTYHGREGGNDTMDSVFLLSYHEAFDVYLTSDEARLCVPTEKLLTVEPIDVSTKYHPDGLPTVRWLLRTTAGYEDFVAHVGNDGEVYPWTADSVMNAVRPVIRVDLSAYVFHQE